MILEFDEFRLDSELFELKSEGVLIDVEPLVFDLISFLALHPDQLVTHDDLINSVWKGRIVSETTVATCIKNARRALGDSGSLQRYIKTVRGRGFRFVGKVRKAHSPSTVGSASPINAERGNPADAPAYSAGPPTVAVLPLYPSGNDPSQQIYGDAIAQEIIVDLSRLHWLRVIARGSSFQYRGPSVDLLAASHRLGARYFLSGSLEFFANVVVVSVEFSHAPSARVLWADRLECQVDELLQLRHSLCARIVAEMESRVERAEAELAAGLSTENLDAWSAYHLGLLHMYRFNRDDNELARQMFERAVSLDKQFARAYAGQSFVHFQNSFLSYSSDVKQDTGLARRMAQKAMELDPHDPFVILTMGRADWLEQSLESAGEWLDRSLRLSPNYAFAQYNRGLMYALHDDGIHAEQSVEKAIELSPIDPLGYAMRCTMALSHMIRGDHDRAMHWVKQSLREPNAHIHISLIGALIHQLAGDRESATKLMRKIRVDDPAYCAEDFFRVFPFRNPDTFAILKNAFHELNDATT